MMALKFSKVHRRNTMNEWFGFDFRQNLYTTSRIFFKELYNYFMYQKWIMVFRLPFICGYKLREIEISNYL